MLKRIVDIILSFGAMLFLLPLFVIIGFLIVIDSKGGVFYKQSRVGLNQMDIGVYKFRTMRKDAHKQGLLTVGGRDPRITRIGYFLRKYKLDELPQLNNILIGEMSIVGPRPEVRKYVDLYTEEQLKVLSVRPGLTDYASIEFMDENDLLAKSENPEKTYIQEIMPIKLNLNLKYIQDESFIVDLKIIYKTIAKILSR